MKKYLVLYHAPMTDEMRERMMNTPPEEMAKGMQMWQDWAERCGSSLVDLGSPVTGGQQLTTGGSAPSNNHVGGYSILQAANMDEAKSLLDGHPHLGAWNPAASIEVHEFMPMPGM